MVWVCEPMLQGKPTSNFYRVQRQLYSATYLICSILYDTSPCWDFCLNVCVTPPPPPPIVVLAMFFIYHRIPQNPPRFRIWISLSHRLSCDLFSSYLIFVACNFHLFNQWFRYLSTIHLEGNCDGLVRFIQWAALIMQCICIKSVTLTGKRTIMLLNLHVMGSFVSIFITGTFWNKSDNYLCW